MCLRVPHRSLMRKLTHYGIGENVHNWTGSFLMQRQQQIIVTGESPRGLTGTTRYCYGSTVIPTLYQQPARPCDIHCTCAFLWMTAWPTGQSGPLTIRSSSNRTCMHSPHRQRLRVWSSTWVSVTSWPRARMCYFQCRFTPYVNLL